MPGGFGGGGRGGRNRGIPLRIGGDPSKILGQGEVAQWLDRETKPAPSRSEADPRIPPGYETVICKPAGYWSLSVLPSLDSVLVRRNFVQTYVSTGLNDLIPPGWTVSNGRVMIVTGYCFQGVVAGVGGITSTIGIPSFLPDTAAAGAIEMNFVVPGGPIETHQNSATGGKGGANELGGSGFFNYGYDRNECPVEIYIPGNTAVKAQYRQITTPYIAPVSMVFRMQGYEVAADTFYKVVGGVKR